MFNINNCKNYKLKEIDEYALSNNISIKGKTKEERCNSMKFSKTNCNRNKVSEIKDFAKKYKISLKGTTKKKDICDTINKNSTSSIKKSSYAELPDINNTHYLPVYNRDRIECVNEYQKQKKLGEGGYGAVFEVCKIADKSNYAMKIMKIKRIEDLNSFYRDVYFLKKLQDTGMGIVPTLYDAWITSPTKKGKDTLKKYKDNEKSFDDKSMSERDMIHLSDSIEKCHFIGYIVMEKMEGDLLDLFKKSTQAEEDKYVKEVEDILQKLTKQGIIHGDIKFDNFLFKTHRGKVKLYVIDFGFSGDFLRYTPMNGSTTATLMEKYFQSGEQ